MKRPHFALPEIYDDSLSYYDVLRKLIKSMHVISDNLNKIPEQIANEAKARLLGDQNLQQNINTEVSAREQADTTLQQNINSEATTRGQADQEIREDMSNKISELKSDLANVKSPYIFPNLYDSSELIDGKLVNNSMGYNYIVTYANGILSGHIPVNEEETYTVKTDSFGIGALFFFQKESDGRYKCICAEERLSTGAYGSWTGIKGLVEDKKHTIKERTFKILKNSGITHVLWYITNSDSTNNYYGSHTETDVDRIKKDVRMFRGTVDYGFHEYGVGFLTEDSILGQKNINDYVRREAGGDKPITYSLNGDDIVLSTEYDGSTWTVDCTKNNPLTGVFKLGWMKKNNVNYKNMGDDIAPFFCDNSYVGSSHGESVGYKLTSENHGKTEQDIGSIYSNNGKEFIILYIVDENTLMMLGEVVPNNQYYEYRFYASAMTGDTLIHVSGGTNTSDIVFSAQTRQVQITPWLKNLSVECKADGYTANENGRCNKFAVNVSYEIIDLVKVRSFLVQNVGNNTNSSYYDSSVDSEIRVTQEVSFDERLSISIKSYFTLLRDSSGARYGVIQAEAFPVANRLTYVPFTNMDTPIKQTGELRIVTWNDENVPPHKYYQFNPNMTDGWVVGYDISYNNSKDTIRKENLKSTGGQINEYTSKMYPYILENLPKKFSIGETVGGVAYCGAVHIENNACHFINRADDHLIVEIEAFDNHALDIIEIKGFEDASVTVLKKDGGINVVSDSVVNGELQWLSTSKGSITLLIN